MGLVAVRERDSEKEREREAQIVRAHTVVREGEDRGDGLAQAEG